MATSPVKITPQKPLEDPLAYLPCSTVLEYRKGEIIYSHDQPHHDLYLVLTGTVKVTRVSDHGTQLLVDLYVGEIAFDGRSERNWGLLVVSIECNVSTLLGCPAFELENFATAGL